MNATHLKLDEQFTKKYSRIGIMVVCLVAFPLHFLFGWSGKSALIGMFTPINESIWEHLKLVYWPLLLWWGIGFRLYHAEYKLSLVKWVSSGAVAILISMIGIVGWYYTWVHGLAVTSSVIDVGSLFIAVPIGQWIAIHLYRVMQLRRIYLFLAFVFLVLAGFLFIYFTFSTPERPIFIPGG